jgi:glycosyltransferase involved in cell wall biosynthesis
MNIALLTDGIYPYVIGGMQRHSFYLAKYLAAAGHKVDLYHTNQSKKDISALELFTAEEKMNIRSFVIPFPSFGSGPGHYIRESYEYSKRVWDAFKKQKQVDFIYVKGFSGWELLNQKDKGATLSPVGLNFHGYEMFQAQPSLLAGLKSRLILRSPVLFNVKHADYLFSYGGKITGIIESLGVPKRKIIEISTGISSEWLNEKPQPSSEKRKFIFVGRFERRKGVEELNAALIKLIARKDFEFHFVGPIPLKKKITSDKIIYHGEINEDGKLRALLQEMDVLVCPSHAEGMPNVVMEALASGLAVIATDTGATGVMVSAENGWLIPPSSVPALLKSLEEAMLCSNETLDDKKKKAVGIVKKNFLWEKIAAETVNSIQAQLKA